MYLYLVIYRNKEKTLKNIFENYEDAITLVKTILEMEDELIKFVRVIKYD